MSFTCYSMSLCFIVFFLCAVASTQSLPPARIDGFAYNKHQGVDSDTVMIEAFLDPVCPDSRDSWDPLMQALHYYGRRLFLIVHLLPLPYHDNAFVASRALHVVNELNGSATFDMLEWFFDNQEKLYNAQTFNMSRTDVVKLIVESVSKVIGDSYYSKLESAFKNRQTDLKTRVSFKYSASRGVFGTPAFFINGFALSGTGSAITYKGWRGYIDPLIHEQGIRSNETVHYLL